MCLFLTQSGAVFLLKWDKNWLHMYATSKLLFIISLFLGLLKLTFFLSVYNVKYSTNDEDDVDNGLKHTQSVVLFTSSF